MKDKLKNILSFEKILELYIIIQFIIDIATSFCVKYVNESLSLGIFVRTGFLIILVCYSFLKSDKKDRIKLIVFYGILGVYLVTFLAICYRTFGTFGIFSQIKGALKTFYLPIILIAFMPIWKKKNIKIKKNVLIYALLGYTGVIFLGRVLKISYLSYPLGNGEGTMGLFYAANEIGVIVSMLAPFTVLELLDGNISFVNIIAMIALVFASLELGTKVPFLSLIIMMCVVLYSCIVKLPNKNERKENIKRLLVTLVVGMLIFLLFPYMPISTNINNAYGFSVPKLINIGAGTSETVPKEKLETKEEIETAVYSSRNIYLSENLGKYRESSLIKKLFGIGYLRENIENNEVTELKLVEIDYYDIFICHGIAGTIVYLIPFMYLVFIIGKKILQNIKDVLLDRELIFMEYSIAIALLVAFTAGHVFTAPAPALFLAVNILQYCKKIDDKSGGK